MLRRRSASPAIAAARRVIAHADELTALDQAIGDGDHGLNMKRGFEAVLADLDALAAKPLPEALKAIGMALVMKVGGASGPLYGTLFMALGKELPAQPTRADARRGLRRGDRRGQGARQVARSGRRPCSTCWRRSLRRAARGRRRSRFAGCRRERCRCRGDQADEGDHAAAPRFSASARSAIWIPGARRAR